MPETHLSESSVPTNFSVLSLATVEGYADGQAKQVRAILTKEDLGTFRTPDGLEIADVRASPQLPSVVEKMVEKILAASPASAVDLQYGGTTEPAVSAAVAIALRGKEVRLQRNNRKKNRYDTYYVVPPLEIQDTSPEESRPRAILGILNRHDYPAEVKDFLFPAQGTTLSWDETPSLTKERVSAWIEAHADIREVDLYYSGLKEATMVTLFELVRSGVSVRLFRFDVQKGTYELYQRIPGCRTVVS